LFISVVAKVMGYSVGQPLLW